MGEGGNLGLTRRARIEYSRGGGRVNADFIDNSAGVDCSDHEVNLKILLGLAERAGELTRPERDELLRAVTDDVVAHVLYDSFLQAQIIAQEVEVVGRAAVRLRGPDGDCSRRTGCSTAPPRTCRPAEEMAERRRAGRGMERPELALLLAYAKRFVRARAARVRRCPRTRGSSATCAATSRPRSSSASASCSPSTRCGAS